MPSDSFCAEIFSSETRYYDPLVSGVPDRRGKYYTFDFIFVSANEDGDEWYSERIDWPVPLCTDPETARKIIEGRFEHGSCQWDRCWN